MGKPYVHRVHLRWSDEDRNGHVNNTRFLTYSEDARLAWLATMAADLGHGLSSSGVIMASLNCQYKAQVHFAQTPELDIDNHVRRLGSSSIELHQIVRHLGDEGAVVADMTNVLVSYDYEANKSVPWNDAQRAWFDQFAEVALDTAAV